MADDRHNTDHARTETAERIANCSEPALKFLIAMLSLNIEQKFEFARQLDLLDCDKAHAVAKNIRAIAASECRH